MMYRYADNIDVLRRIYEKVIHGMEWYIYKPKKNSKGTKVY